MAGGACLLARAKLAQYVEGLKTSAAAERGGSLVKAGLLASAKTHERNFIGNAAMGGVNYLATRPAAVAVDYLTALSKAAREGGSIASHRTIASTLNPGGARALLAGFGEGSKKGFQLMKTGVDVDHVAQKFEVSGTRFKNPVIDKAVSTVFNAMEAADKPFFQSAFREDLYGRARLIGIQEGKTGAALAKRAAELVQNPTEEMIVGATEHASQLTFKDDTWLATAIGGAKETLKRKLDKATPGNRIGLSGALLASDVVLPFAKVPSSVLSSAIDYSPFGYVTTLIREADKNPKIQAQFAQGLAKATIGTGLTALGWTLYGNGAVANGKTDSNTERTLNTTDNRPLNAVKIGNKWLSVSALGPFAMPIILGAAMRKYAESEHNTGSALDAAATGAGTMAKSVTEQSALYGLSSAIDALHSGGNVAANTAAGMIPVPPLLSQVGQGIDPVQRQANGFVDRVRTKIPGASLGLPAKLDVFGDTVRRGPGGLPGIAKTVFDPTNAREDQTTPLTAELRRVGARISMPSKSLRDHGVATQLSGEEYNALLQEFGPIKRALLEKIIAAPDYQRADDDEKQARLERALSQIQQMGTQITKGRRAGVSIPRQTPTSVFGVAP